MSATAVGYLIGSAIGTVGMQLAVRFVLLRFVSRRTASLLAAVLMLAAGFYAGAEGPVIVVAAAILLFAQMAKEPPKEKG